MTSVLLNVKNIKKSFGGIDAIRDVSFDIFSGECVGLVGPNGAGKTTCFNLITGYYTADSGNVLFKGEDITNTKPHDMIHYGISRSFQKTNVLGNLSVKDNIISACHVQGRQSLWRTFFPNKDVRITEQNIEKRADYIVELLGLDSERDTISENLPCGVLRLLEVGIAIAPKPELLMLDEPAAGLNNDEAMKLVQMLKQVLEAELEALLVVEHNMAFVMDISDRIVVMDFGKKIADDLPDVVQKDPKVISAYLGRPES